VSDEVTDYTHCGRNVSDEAIDYTHCGRNVSDEATDCRVPWENIKEDRQNQKEDRGKTLEPAKGKAPTPYVVVHCSIGVIEDLFNISYTPWRDTWLLDIGANSYMAFRRDFFEDFNDIVDDVVYCVDKLCLKPSGMGTIRLKLLGLPTFLLHNVLYLPKL
jgi:hypothetical protein